MIINALFAFVHFAAVFGIFSTVAYELLTMSRAPSLADARRIQLCDRWYGISAGVVLVVGLLRVGYFEKGVAFYQANPFFHAKLTLFVIVGLISIYPTMRFIKWRQHTRQGQPPVVSEQEYTRIVLILRTELALLLGMALCASLMARAVGM
jgi:putative membrane protein